MADWYETGLKQLQEEGAGKSGVTVDRFCAVYNFLVEAGLIDYDIEKEAILDRYYDDGATDV